MKMGTNLGCLCDYIEVQYGQIWNAVRKARNGFELPQAAMICVLNKLKYPDECYAKVLQMRHVMIKPLHTESEYLYVKRRTFERGFFIQKNYKQLP